MRTQTGSMRRMKRAAMLALCATLALAGRSFGDVISEKVPDGSLAVLKFSNIGQTSGKVAKLAEQLGLNMFVPQLNDPLGALKQQLKLANGINDAGDIAFVFTDTKGGPPDKSTLVLVPTTDYKTLIANLEGATTEGAVTTFQPPEGKTVYLADWGGGYAAVSPTKELISGTPGTGLKLPARAAKETSGNDVALFANFAALRGPLTEQINKNRERTKQEITKRLEGDNQIPAAYHPAITAGFEQALMVMESFVRDADAATVGITLTDTGIKQNVVAQFTEGSYLAKLADGFHDTDGALLTGLPAGKFLAFGGFANSPTALNQLIDDLSGPIVAALPKDDEKVAFIPGYLTDIKALLGSIKGQSFGLVTPTGPIGQVGIIQPIGALRGDADKILSGMKAANDKYAANVNALVALSQPGVEMKQTFAENVKTVDGISFSSVSTEIGGDSPAANQQRQAMQLTYGGPKVEFFFGNAGGNVASFVQGVDDATVSALIAATKANDAPLAKAEPVKAVADNLPKGRFVEVYIAVDEILGLGMRAASQFGFMRANSVPVPPDLQPIGLSLASEAGAIEYSAYISNDLLQALVTAGTQIAGQMQGGGGGRGGPGGPGGGGL